MSMQSLNNSSTTIFPSESESIYHPKPSNQDSNQNITSEQIFEGLDIQTPLSSSRSDVYLAQSGANKNQYALKIFNFQEDQPSPFFMNEARFVELDHPHILNSKHVQGEFILEVETEQINGQPEVQEQKVSLALAEYAPNGDLLEVLSKPELCNDEIMIRSLFYQIVDGLEYLHENDIAHLDIKPENLVFDKDYRLRIIDFDLAAHIEDNDFQLRGTKNYRALEMTNGTCEDPRKADIFSLAVVLFVMKSKGVMPYYEATEEDDNALAGDLLEVFFKDTKKFWQKHCRIQATTMLSFPSEFRKLFEIMFTRDEANRATIRDIKESAWYNGPIYTAEEYKKKMAQVFKEKRN